MVKRAVAIAVLSLAWAQTTAGLQQQRAGSGLQRLLDAELSRFPGRAGVWVKHLTTGEEAGVLADETFNSASVITHHDYGCGRARRLRYLPLP